MAKPLWERSDLGPWSDASPVHLCAMFRRYQAGRLPERRRETYARLLMHVVVIQFTQHGFRRRLPEVGLVPDDVAQDAVLHLLRKTLTMQMKHDGWRPLMRVLNVTVYRFVLTQVATRKRKSCREIAATDYLRLGRDRASDGIGVAVEAESAEPPTMERLQELLEDERWVDRVIGDIISTDRQARAIETGLSYLRAKLLHGAGIVPHAALPTELKMELSLELHGIIATRLSRTVRRFVG